MQDVSSVHVGGQLVSNTLTGMIVSLLHIPHACLRSPVIVQARKKSTYFIENKYISWLCRF